MDEQQTILPGSGWVQSGVLWLAEGLEPGNREVRMVRWRADTGGELVREENHASVQELLAEEYRGWRRASDVEVEQLMAALTRTDAGDAVQAMRQAAKKATEYEKGAIIDRDREAGRLEDLTRREEATATPALVKSFWGQPTTEAGTPDLTVPPPRVEPKTVTTTTQGAEATRTTLGAMAEAGMAERQRRLSAQEVRANAPVEERAGLVPPREVTFPHDYPGAPGHDPTDPGHCFTSDCVYGCGCYAGPSRSGSRAEGVDPFGECPKNPQLLAIKQGEFYREMMARPLAQAEALRLAVEDRERRDWLLELSLRLEDTAARMLYEARELRRLADVTDQNDGGGTGGA